jgi:hypothetical protein
MKYKRLPLFCEVLQPKLIEEGSKRVKLNPRTLSDMKYVTEKVWKDYLNKDDEEPKKGTIMVLDSAGDHVDIPVYYVSSVDVQGGVYQIDASKPRTLYNLFILVNPDKSIVPSKKNLYQTLYHEVQHIMDLNTVQYLNKKEIEKYRNTDDDDESLYWGHDFEFRAFTNEFLEALTNEYNGLIGKIENDKISSSLDSVLDYFGRNGEIDEIGRDVLYSMTSESDESGELPYSINVLSLVKRHNPGKWNSFLKMLYTTVLDIKNSLKSEKKISEGFFKPRKYSKKYCESTSCGKMGFSQRASCRPYKNCYK